VDLLEATLKSIGRQEQSWRAKARARLEQLTMPHWALGRLMDLAEDLAGMTRSLHPPVSGKTIITMAADHGVVGERVSAYPQVVTRQMVHNFVSEGASINALARLAGARVVVVDMGVVGDLGALVSSGKVVCKRVGPGTDNIARGPAMTREEAIRCLVAGIEVVREQALATDVLGTGDMGIGNTTASAAVAAALTGCPAAQVTGRGTGVDDDRLKHKVTVVEQALAANKPDPNDAIDVLAKVGGFEIGGIAGVILAAASLHKPVVLDGFISTAGALIAQALAPAAADYMIAGHRSNERGHQVMLAHLGKTPLLDLGLRLGEGTGGALAMNLVDAAALILTEVRTFEEASVSEAEP